MKNTNVSQLDYWYHRYLLGDSNAPFYLNEMLNVGLKKGCLNSKKIKKKIEKSKNKRKNIFIRKYDTSKIVVIFSPIYKYFLAYIGLFSLSMVFVAGGYNVF